MTRRGERQGDFHFRRPHCRSGSDGLPNETASHPAGIHRQHRGGDSSREDGRLDDRSLFWHTVLRDAARVGKWKYLKDSGQEHLFDLEIDPGEKTDLRSAHPEVFDRIKAQYLAWNARMLPKPAG
jgi:hypothetical protein